MNDGQKKLTQLLKEFQANPGADFDQTFWKRFNNATAFPIAIVAGTAAGVVLAGFLLLSPLLQEKPKVLVYHGNVSLFTVKGKAETVLPGKTISRGQQIQVANNSWLVLEFPNGYRIQLEPGSELSVKNLKKKWLPGKTSFLLSSGNALVSIGEEGGIQKNYPLEMRTPFAFARAMGTQFTVSAAPSDKAMSVQVLRGVVKAGVLNTGSKNIVSLQAGNQWAVDKQNTPKLSSIEFKKLKELEEAFQFGRKNQCFLLISLSGERYRELLKPCAIFVQLEPQSVEAEAFSMFVRQIEEYDENENREAILQAAEHLENEILKPGSKLNMISIELFLGAYYDRFEDSKNAVRVFENAALRHPDSSMASLALMAAASIYEEKLRNPEKATSLAAEILKNYPESYERIPAKKILDSYPS